MPEQRTTTDWRSRAGKWFQPDTELPPSLIAARKQIWGDDATAYEILSRLDQWRMGSLAWADRLDRKLLAVLTANGVYIALLATVHDTLHHLAIWPSGVFALFSLVLAAMAWRPHGYQTIRIESLLRYHEKDIDTVIDFLIKANIATSHVVDSINIWKAQKLKLAIRSFLASAVFLTIALLVAAGE